MSDVYIDCMIEIVKAMAVFDGATLGIGQMIALLYGCMYGETI